MTWLPLPSSSALRRYPYPSSAHPGDWWAHQRPVNVKESASFEPQHPFPWLQSHGTTKKGIFTYIFTIQKNQANAGKHTSPMDGMGWDVAQFNSKHWDHILFWKVSKWRTKTTKGLYNWGCVKLWNGNSLNRLLVPYMPWGISLFVNLYTRSCQGDLPPSNNDYKDDQRCLGEDPYWPPLSTNILGKQSSMFAY